MTTDLLWRRIIEVTYKTESPYGVYAGKGPQFATEYAKKDKAVQDYLETRLPPGVKLLTSHQHYSPDRVDPERVGMHIHAHKRVEDLDEAKIIAEKLAETIKPVQINRMLEKV